MIEVDPETVHGAPVFKATRLPVETAIDSVLAYQELEGSSEDQAIVETLVSFPTISGAEALRSVLAFEAAYQPQLSL